ncbi:hypothetical protein RRG08_029700 [Elysia crispata]|uniref:Secreted protein n=1 Tax=Elysia crispata TaxID=231223 RepID=A0AAE1DDT4_9GAST|nr:hypothetical protein RRG08_029700 [Elysia crispata]
MKRLALTVVLAVSALLVECRLLKQNETSDEVDTLLTFPNYLNGYHLQHIVQAAMISSCLKDKETLTGIGIRFFVCYSQFLHEIMEHGLCQAVAVFERCSVNFVSTVCGASAVGLLQSVWDNLKDPATTKPVLSMVNMPPEVVMMISSCQQQALRGPDHREVL